MRLFKSTPGPNTAFLIHKVETCFYVALCIPFWVIEFTVSLVPTRHLIIDNHYTYQATKNVLYLSIRCDLLSWMALSQILQEIVFTKKKMDVARKFLLLREHSNRKKKIKIILISCLNIDRNLELKSESPFWWLWQNTTPVFYKVHLITRYINNISPKFLSLPSKLK